MKDIKKIKVLHFPITNARSGVAQYVLNNWSIIDKGLFQFDFATMNNELDFEQSLLDQGCKIHYLSCYAEDNKAQFIKEFEQILDEEYDIVHLHTSFWKSFLVEELAIRKKVPKIIVHSHSTMVDIVDESAREAAVLLHSIRREQFTPSFATDFWACSWEAADWLFGEQIQRDTIRIMKNAIDVNAFSYNKKTRDEYRSELGLNDCFVLGHTGRFLYTKNHEMLIDVFYQVSSIIPHARLMLIGKGQQEIRIREKVERYGLTDKVLFMGARDDVNALLQAMDMFLLPSIFEGLGIALIEAQAAGLKCVASDSVPKEVQITDNLEFLPLNIQDWTEAILKYADGYNRIKTDDLVNKAGFNIRSQIKELENLYSIL